MVNARNTYGYSFLQKYCGINLSNNKYDDGAITGTDAGGSSPKNQESIIPENGSLDTNFCDREFTTPSGLKVVLDSNVDITNNKDKRFIWQCLRQWWIEGATNLIKDSYGDYFNVQGMTLEVTFKKDSDNVPGWGAAAYGLTNGFLHLEINEDKYKDMNKSNYNGVSSKKMSNGNTTPYLDRLIAHELTHAITGANGIAAKMPQFITEGLAELTRGIDTQYFYRIKDLANGKASLSEWLNVDDTNTGNWYAYAAGYMFLRYLAKQGAGSYSKDVLFTNDNDNRQNTQSGQVLNAFSGNDTIGNWGNNVTINAGTGNDSIFNDQQGYSSSIDTGDGDDTIWSWGANSTLNLGWGNDSVKNHVVNITMYGGYGSDTLESWNVGNVKMYGEAGDDHLTNSAGNYVTMDGGADNDSIYNDGTHASINAGADNDSVRNWQGNNSKIELGVGSDSITNDKSSNVTIDGGNDNDIIHNVNGSTYASIVGGYGNDFVWNENSQYVTINGGYGDDSIRNFSSNVKMYGDDGDDYMTNDAGNVTINASYGNDFVWNFNGINSKIELGEGRDSVTNWHGSSSTIDGGNNDDFIHNNDSSYSSIKGGAGNDTIRNESSGRVTISGDSGNDIISIDGSSAYTVIKYAAGDGNDTIYGYNSNDTISLGGGYYTRETIGTNVIVSLVSGGAMTLSGASGKTINIIGGTLTVPAIFTNGADYYSNSKSSIVLNALSGNDTVINSGTNVTINGDAGADSISNTAQNVIINGGADNDLVRNYSNYVSINSGFGKDTVRNQGNYTTIQGDSDNDLIINGDYFEKGGTNIKVYGGDGADSINNSGSYSLLDGGSGSDVIHNGYYYYEPWNTYYENSYYYQYDDANGTANVTIKGGTGNDEIYNNGKKTTYLYKTGDGNDTIYGIKANDTLQITGAKYSRSTVGNDIKISVGSGSILLKDALNIAFTTDGTLENSNTISNSVISGSGSNDSIYVANANYVTIYAGNGADTIKGNYYNSKIYGGTGNDYINVVDEDVYKKSYVLLTSRNIRLPSVMGGSLTNTIDGGDGDDTINIVNFSPSSINGGNGNDKIYLAGDYAFLPSRTVAGGKGNDIIYGVVDIKGNTNALRYNGFIGTYYQYSYGDGNDTIYNFHSKDTISIGGSSSYTTLKSGDNVVVSIIGSGSITLYNDLYNSTKNKKINIVGGKYDGNANLGTTGGGIGGQTLGGGAEYSIGGGILTVFDNFKGNKIDLSDYSTASKVNATALSKNVSIVGTAAANSMKGGNAADTINGNAGADIIYGGSGNDKIYGGNDNDKLYGDAGNDSLYGNAGNDTLTGGAGNDIFVYESGNDLITDYAAGQDKIKFGVAISSSSISGNNVIFKTSKGNVTVQNGKGKKITVIDSTGKTTTKTYPESNPLPNGWKYGTSASTNNTATIITATLNSAANVDLNQTYGKNVTKVDGIKVTKAISITGKATADSLKGGSGADTIKGNAGNDTVYGGIGNDTIYGGANNDKIYGDAGNDKLYGDAGNDSLYGGSGNDTFTGGEGNDVFIYEGGKDVITDYTAGQDKIEISSGKITKTSYSGKDVIFTIGSGTLTVKNGKGKKITVKDSSNKTQTYSRTLDLMYDNNFISDDFSLDSITEKKYSVTQIQISKTEIFAHNETFLTFTDDK